MNAEKQTVLVVDDAPENIDILVGTLKEKYNVKAAVNGEMAIRIAKANLITYEPKPQIFFRGARSVIPPLW